MVTASRFTESPVGPYLQLAVAVPARLGGRLGWCVTHLVVDNQDARSGARLNWGFPAELGTLRWREDGLEQELVWEEREVLVRGRGRGPRVPLAVPHRELQQRGDGPVMVPDRLLGMFRLASVRIQAFHGDALAHPRRPPPRHGRVGRQPRDARGPHPRRADRARSGRRSPSPSRCCRSCHAPRDG